MRLLWEFVEVFVFCEFSVLGKVWISWGKWNMLYWFVNRVEYFDKCCDFRKRVEGDGGDLGNIYVYDSVLDSVGVCLWVVIGVMGI